MANRKKVPYCIALNEPSEERIVDALKFLGECWLRHNGLTGEVVVRKLEEPSARPKEAGVAK